MSAADIPTPPGISLDDLDEPPRSVGTARMEADGTLRLMFRTETPSGMIGESPKGVPNNLFPLIAQAAAGLREHVQVFGDDYPTPDGTGIRDYVHVVDLARGHLAALQYLSKESITCNLGTGRGYSVLEVVKAFERACGRKLALEFAPRRPGDIAASYADAGLAARALGWQASLGIDDMCRDIWRWQSSNPNGY